MKTVNIAIIILFILIVILIYQLCSKRKKEGFNTNYTPLNLNDLQKIVDGDSKQAIMTNNINYGKLQRIIKLDIHQKEITVEAGCSIKDICTHLEKYNLALASVPFDIEQSIGNACSFAAHGSDLNGGTMSDQVIDLIMIIANGHLYRIEFNDPEFPAFATSLGTLGLPYSITLKCVDYYTLETNQFTDHWDNLKQTLDNLRQNCSMITIVIQPNTKVANVTCKYKTTNGTNGPNGRYYDQEHPNEQNNADKTKLHVAVPIEKTVSAIDAVIGNDPGGEICISFTGADYNSWLSPASGRESTWITTAYESPITAQECENKLIESCGGRPDWKTMHNFDKIKELYGMSLNYVAKVKNTFDPQDIFKKD